MRPLRPEQVLRMTTCCTSCAASPQARHRGALLGLPCLFARRCLLHTSMRPVLAPCDPSHCDAPHRACPSIGFHSLPSTYGVAPGAHGAASGSEAASAAAPSLLVGTRACRQLRLLAPSSFSFLIHPHVTQYDVTDAWFSTCIVQGALGSAMAPGAGAAMGGGGMEAMASQMAGNPIFQAVGTEAPHVAAYMQPGTMGNSSKL